MQSNITRRLFIASGASALLSLFISKSWSYSLSGCSHHVPFYPDVESNLMNLFDNIDSPRLIGEKYLEKYIHEKSGSWLLKSIFNSTYPSSSETLKTFLSDKINQDFQMSDIVFIDGWVLARTEGRVCALTALFDNHNDVYRFQDA